MKNAKAIVIASHLKSLLFKGEFDAFAQMFEDLKNNTPFFVSGGSGENQRTGCITPQKTDYNEVVEILLDDFSLLAYRSLSANEEENTNQRIMRYKALFPWLSLHQQLVVYRNHFSRYAPDLEIVAEMKSVNSGDSAIRFADTQFMGVTVATMLFFWGYVDACQSVLEKTNTTFETLVSEAYIHFKNNGSHGSFLFRLDEPMPLLTILAVNVSEQNTEHLLKNVEKNTLWGAVKEAETLIAQCCIKRQQFAEDVLKSSEKLFKPFQSQVERSILMDAIEDLSALSSAAKRKL